MRILLTTSLLGIAQMAATTACQPFEQYVHVADPHAAHAEERWSGTHLSEGSSGTIEYSGDTRVSLPTGNRFRLPTYCANGLLLGAQGAPPMQLASFSKLHPELIERREAAPQKPIDLGCASSRELARIVSVVGPPQQGSLNLHEGYTLSTPPSNINQLEQRSHAIATASGLTAVFAGAVATVCGIGVAVSKPPPDRPDPDLARQKSAFTTCALITAPITLVGAVVAIIDPTIVTRFDMTAPAAADRGATGPSARPQRRRKKWVGD